MIMNNRDKANAFAFASKTDAEAVIATWRTDPEFTDDCRIEEYGTRFVIGFYDDGELIGYI